MADTWSDEGMGPPGSANPGDNSRVEFSPWRVPLQIATVSGKENRLSASSRGVAAHQCRESLGEGLGLLPPVPLPI